MVQSKSRPQPDFNAVVHRCQTQAQSGPRYQMSTGAGQPVDSAYTTNSTNPRMPCRWVDIKQTGPTSFPSSVDFHQRPHAASRTTPSKNGQRKGGKQELSRQVGSSLSVPQKRLLLLLFACEKRLPLKYNSEGYKQRKRHNFFFIYSFKKLMFMFMHFADAFIQRDLQMKI